jgi:hypothetical protein
MIHFPFISRPITSRPWDRIPSHTWYYADATFSPLASLVLIGSSFLFPLAWNFHFPTYVEKLLWRICSVYHNAFSLYGGIYYLIEVFSSRKQKSVHKPSQPRAPSSTRVQDAEAQLKSPVYRHIKNRVNRCGKLVMDWIGSWRNISPEQDPNMEIPLRILVPVTITCALYILCRLFICFEDFFALRAQPAGVYVTVNRFMPLLVG